jgi:hypothetical protein
MTPEQDLIEQALVVWFAEQDELNDRRADEAEAPDDPATSEAVRDQLEVCMEVAAALINTMGRMILRTVDEPRTEPADAFTPPF